MGNCRDRRRWPCDIRERRDRCDGKGRFLPLQRLAASGWLRVDAAGDLSEPQD
jgi:arginine-tRNA-protein transferase